MNKALVIVLGEASTICAILWVISYVLPRPGPPEWVPSVTIRSSTNSATVIYLHGGEIDVKYGAGITVKEMGEYSSFKVPGMTIERSFSARGRRRPGTARISLNIQVALWIPVLGFGSYPVVALVRGRVRRWRRRQRGLCVKCGYDLTGSISERCSECGEAILSRGAENAARNERPKPGQPG